MILRDTVIPHPFCEQSPNVIPHELAINIFRWKLPSMMLQDLAEGGVLSGDLSLLDGKECDVHDLPHFVDKACMHFAWVDHDINSLADNKDLEMITRLDLMFSLYTEALRLKLGPCRFYRPGDLEIATLIRLLADNKEWGWKLFPARTLLRTYPKEGMVLVLLAYIEKEGLRLYLHKIPSDYVGMQYENSAFLLTRPDPIEGRAMYSDRRYYELRKE